MELIQAENTDIAGETFKVVETPNNFIFNTQVYDKTSLKPVPFEFFSLGTSVHKQMILHKSIANRNNVDSSCYRNQIDCHFTPDYEYIIQDKTNPDYYYYTYRYRQLYNRYYGIGTQFVKAKSIENNIEVVQDINIRDSYYVSSSSGTGNAERRVRNNIKILYDTNDYFIAELKNAMGNYNGNPWNFYPDTGNSGSIGYTGTGIIKVSKKDLTSWTNLWGTYYDSSQSYNNSSSKNAYTSTICPNCGYQVYYLEHKNNIGYLLVNVYKYTYIFRIDTESNAVNQSILKLSNGAYGAHNSGGYQCSSNPIKIGDYYYSLIDQYNSTDAKHEYAFLKIKLDFENCSAEYEIVPIDINSANFIPSNTYPDFLHTVTKFEKNGNTYITITKHSVQDYAFYEEYCSHTTLKMETNKFTVVDFIPLYQGCMGLLNYINPEVCIINTPTAVRFFHFNADKEKYIETYNHPGIYISIGFDMMNRLLLEKLDTKVEMITYSTCTTLVADFAKEEYDMTTSTTGKIPSSVSFYGKNFADEYIAANVTLTIIGPATFDDSNSKTIDTQTLSTGERTLPITIKGCGKLQVIINQS